MQFKPTLLALALAAVSTGAFAAPVAISDLTISSGAFGFSPSYGSNFGAVTLGLPGGNIVSGYGSQSNLFLFNGSPVSVYTGDGTTTPFGGTAVSGGPVPSGTIDSATNSISLNLSAWTANYQTQNFNQGSSAATGTWNPGTGAFTASWSSLIQGGIYNGVTGYWTVTGTAMAAPVPEASTYGMMVVGLGLVGAAVMRRRKV